MVDEFVAIEDVVHQESVPSIFLWDAMNAIVQVCHGKGMILVFRVWYCIKIESGNNLLLRLSGTAALYVHAPSSDSAQTISAQPLISSSSVFNFVSVAEVPRLLSAHLSNPIKAPDGW
ncbi:uncharacterized protein MONOS_16082 [Monocercomonoides exilis]|uniref:uncharacterized protein n=1 Tax=Monocercomonoides exilis TaxID=2049356 RepID=UPI00355A9998|nr:hypothetical protein MONOS_16082 [Monocercomonoides exilis]|eukprot:MONOS_16082.1-p1 / transcript=MONOS_16082.1 / gene=MONOS_16082 / organism=Monocercomonoides_exilis_PA203 / gene_product=unspecified product / transcript_product=unspecified product / location=Mono_scaffold01497:2523-2951(-) / protein_length=118 / sequence_SO=supercontig / SO=protein_coding / is_pseudo=false